MISASPYNMQMNGIVTVDVRRVEANRSSQTTDRVAAEAPLEVRLHGEPFSVIMDSVVRLTRRAAECRDADSTIPLSEASLSP